jgi:hypothetical protein
MPALPKLACFLSLLVATTACSDGEESPAGTDGSGGTGGGGAGGGAGAAGSAGVDGGNAGSTSDAGGEPVTPTAFRVTLRNVSQPGSATTSTGADLPIVFGPGVFLVHSGDPPWFEAGSAASPGLERLAEDGAVDDALAEALDRPGVVAGFFGADELGVSYDETPIAPGTSADFPFEARPGARLELGTMWAQSNDVFVATRPGGIALFDGSTPRLGMVVELTFWEAGTEVNQEPGLGDAQAPRQPEPDFGTTETGVITEIVGGTDASGFSYPPLSGTLEVEIALDE